MNRRAGDMRTYAQDTALPGGKYEEGDIDAEGTAVWRVSLSKSRR
jgi:coenzyme A diphosphatase NUDT7